MYLSVCRKKKKGLFSFLQTVIKSSGHDVTIECATDKSPQDGAYMYKQGESKQQQLFYFYKENNLTFKTANKSKVRVSGALPNLSVTLLHVTAEDIGLYWCDFNLEEKNTVGKFTWLWIGKCILLHVNNCILKHDEFIIWMYRMCLVCKWCEWENFDGEI